MELLPNQSFLNKMSINEFLYWKNAQQNSADFLPKYCFQNCLNNPEFILLACALKKNAATADWP